MSIICYVCFSVQKEPRESGAFLVCGGGDVMPSTNPRYLNPTLRNKTRSLIISRVQAGEPCALCGQAIDLSLPQTYIDPRDGKRKRAPWSLEVDEIIPISRGGLPYGDNCQPVHRLCNQRAGNKKSNKQINTAANTGRKFVDRQIETSRDW